jgi:hypothetical protein
MTTDTTDDDRLSEAYELGCNRGWEHANFVNAYGPEHERNKPDYPAWMITDPAALGYVRGQSSERIPAMIAEQRDQRLVWQAEFKRGWTDGRRRFHRGQYPDGTQRED